MTPELDLRDITAQRVQEVFDAVFEATDTFRERNIGANLAYLMGAMLDRVTGKEPDSFVDWSCDQVGVDGWWLWALLKRDLPAGHPAFTCIVSYDGEPLALDPDV